jgi:hypothetical protein
MRYVLQFLGVLAAVAIPAASSFGQTAPLPEPPASAGALIASSDTPAAEPTLDAVVADRAVPTGSKHRPANIAIGSCTPDTAATTATCP